MKKATRYLLALLASAIIWALFITIMTLTDSAGFVMMFIMCACIVGAWRFIVHYGEDGETESAQKPQEPTTSGQEPAEKVVEEVSLKEYAMSTLALDLPVTGGWGSSKDDAIVITIADRVKAIEAEHDIMRCLARKEGCAYDKSSMSQMLITSGGKRYDVIYADFVRYYDGEKISTNHEVFFDVTILFAQ